MPKSEHVKVLCYNCKAWLANTKNIKLNTVNTAGSDEGECRLFPPLISSNNTVFPTTDEDDFCFFGLEKEE